MTQTNRNEKTDNQNNDTNCKNKDEKLFVFIDDEGEEVLWIPKEMWTEWKPEGYKKIV